MAHCCGAGEAEGATVAEGSGAGESSGVAEEAGETSGEVLVFGSARPKAGGVVVASGSL